MKCRDGTKPERWAEQGKAEGKGRKVCDGRETRCACSVGKAREGQVWRDGEKVRGKEEGKGREEENGRMKGQGREKQDRARQEE